MKKAFIFIFIVIFNLSLQGQSDRFSAMDNLPEAQMAERARSLVHQLEVIIKLVIKNGQKGEDNIDVELDGFMDYVLDSTVTIQTCSKRKDCVKINSGKPYDKYLLGLFQLARRSRNLNIDFEYVETIRVNPSKFICIVEFKQKYKSGRYEDETIKEVEVLFKPNKYGDPVGKIGKCIVKLKPGEVRCD